MAGQQYHSSVAEPTDLALALAVGVVILCFAYVIETGKLDPILRQKLNYVAN